MSAKNASNKSRNLRKRNIKIKWKIVRICNECGQSLRNPSDTDLINFICDRVDRERKILAIIPTGVRFEGKGPECATAREAIIDLMRRTKKCG